jgi:hypothetical protein
LADLHFKILKYTDLAPLDYYLLSSLKKHLKGRQLSSTEEAALAADGWFAAQSKELLLDGLKKL